MSRRRTQTLEMSLQNRLSTYMMKLEDIWNEIGISDRTIASRGDTALMHLENLMARMVDEELGLKSKLEANLKRWSSEISQLRAQLGITDDCHDDISTSTLRSGEYQVTHSSNDLSKGILFKEKTAKAVLRSLNEIVDNRKQEMKLLWEQEKHFCQHLSFPFSSAKVDHEDLSVRRIDSMKERIKSLEDTYNFRLTLFHQLRDKILDKLEFYKLKPNNEFTREIAEASDEPLFPLSKENIDKMTETLENIELTKRKLQTDLIKKQLQNLWKLLNISQDEQNKFSMKYFRQDIDDATLMVLKDEVKHLQACYQTQIKNLITSTRKKLLAAREEYFLQEKLGDIVSPDKNEWETDADELKAIQSETELVNELGRQRLSVTTHLKSFKTCIDRMCFLEKSNNDKSRLKNRGGALLAEEKERNQMKKQIEKLKKIIQDAIKEWKCHHNDAEFYVNGQHPDDFIDGQWERLSSLKGKINQQRQTRKQREIHREMRFGSKNPNKSARSKTHNVEGKLKFDDSHLMPWGNFYAKPITSTIDKGKNSKTTDELQCLSNDLMDFRKLRRRSKSWSDLAPAMIHREKSVSMPLSLDSIERRRLKNLTLNEQSASAAGKKEHPYSETISSDLNESVQKQPRIDETLASQIAPEDEFKGLLATILNEEPKSRSSAIGVNSMCHSNGYKD